MWLGRINSLQELSFDLIVKEFERFSSAFVSSDDKYLQRLFEFLQRRYSDELVKALHLRGDIKKEYSELLINKHLTSLYDGWLIKTRYLKSPKKALSRLPNLTSICFSCCGNELLKHLADFCPKISEIDIRYSNINDNGLKYLCKRKNGRLPCPELKNIVLRGALVTNKGVENLIRNIPTLESIDYSSLPRLLHHIHEENLKGIRRELYCNLVEINLMEFEHLPYFCDILESCFTVCPKLESFACNITKREMLNFFTGSDLKQLELKFLTEGSKLNIDEFLKVHGRRLTFLSISNCTVSLSVLALHCSVLGEVEVEYVDFVDDNVDLLPSFSSLTACTFHQIDVSVDKAVTSLLSCTPNLEAIAFIVGELSLEVRTRILIWCKRPVAKVIDFQYLELQMEFLMQILLSCPSLLQMSLTYCNVDVKDPREIFLTLKKMTTNKPEIFFL